MNETIESGGRNYHVDKPTADDIKRAIAESGWWLQLLDDGWLCWCCDLYDPDGNQVGEDECALTPEQAVAQAWVRYWAPIRPILPGIVPLTVPDGWRFELRPPLTDEECAMPGFGPDDVARDREERLKELRAEYEPGPEPQQLELPL